MAQLRSRLRRADPGGAEAGEAGELDRVALDRVALDRVALDRVALDRVAFRAAVLAVVARIPEGCVASYVQVARMAGFPRRPRQVGMILKGLPEGTDLPWHRVVNNRGYIPSRGRWWGATVQAIRLREEGVEVDAEGNLEIEGYRWDGEG